jgi:hypothetical protein
VTTPDSDVDHLDVESAPAAEQAEPTLPPPTDASPLPAERRTVMEPVPTAALVADYSAVDAFLEGRHSQPHDLLGHHLGHGRADDHVLPANGGECASQAR